MYLFTNGKLRAGNIDPYLPSSLARNPTLFDYFVPNEVLPHVDEHEKPLDPLKKYITLRDIHYVNNMVDLFVKFKFGLMMLIENQPVNADTSA